MILRERIDGLAFWEIEEDKLRFVTDEIILSMSAMYGSCMPSTELMAGYISDEIISLIRDFGYDEFTVREIILSMRMNMQEMIKNPVGDDFKPVDAPTSVCTAFLGAVLNNYKKLRNSLDRIIENHLKGY